MTNVHVRCSITDWQGVDKELQVYMGLLILEGVYRSKKSTQICRVLLQASSVKAGCNATFVRTEREELAAPAANVRGLQAKTKVCAFVASAPPEQRLTPSIKH